ncbi:MAG: hypothetical protein QNJ17_02755 [Desulfocapsaceae bacterium]|nr:hypothetical protein [Desulfocapsaceae bacterium]
MALRKVIADSSSIILLQKVDLFDVFCDQYNLVITEDVFAELTSNGKKGSAYLRKVLRDWVRQPLPESIDHSMGQGEASSIALFLEGGGDFVLLDDKKGANYCRNKSIPFINSLLVSRLLYISGAIDAAAYDRTTMQLTKQGYYSEKIINRAENINKNELSRFLPQPL